MKYGALLLWLFMAASVQAQVFPTSLGGIVLGEDIAGIQGICRMDTAIPLSQERHLMEVQLKPNHIPGVRSGTVAYAACQEVGRIVRIKFKFDNDSRQFFDELLRRYQNSFGKPLEWRGDPFQTVRSWKWSFQNSQGEQVNLELTHSQDESAKTGNSVKMTLRSLWLSENKCQQAKSAPGMAANPGPTPPHQLDYQLLIPQ